MSITAAKLVNLSANSGVQRKPPGDKFMAQVELAFDTSYPTGGYLIDSPTLANLLGWYSVDMIVPHSIGPNLTSMFADFAYDQPNKKLKFFQSTGVETTAAQSTSGAGILVYCLVFGS